MRQAVEFMVTKEIPRSVQMKDAYEFDERKGWVWLQRLCFFALEKIGCYAYKEEYAYERYAVDPDDVITKILKQDDELIYRYYRKGSMILVGPEEYCELTGNPDIRQLISFTGQAKIGDPGGITVVNIPVKVIPWMKGMLVMPDLNDLK